MLEKKVEGYEQQLIRKAIDALVSNENLHKPRAGESGCFFPDNYSLVKGEVQIHDARAHENCPISGSTTRKPETERLVLPGCNKLTANECCGFTDSQSWTELDDLSC